MSDILDFAFMREAVKSCHYFWEAGWGEFHAGNMSYLLDEEQLSELSPFFSDDPVHVSISFDPSGLVGRTFLVTSSGGQFRTIDIRSKEDLGIIRIGEDGYDILWGFDGGKKRATSELPAHMLCHAARLAKNSDNRLVMHCHPTNLIAMTTVHELEEKSFYKTLWSLNSECILVFPDGIGMLPWMICGEGPIGPATAEKMQQYRVVIWPDHGIFASGNSFDEAIGLIETIDKNAKVYLASGGNPKNVISDEQLQQLANHFGLETAEF